MPSQPSAQAWAEDDRAIGHISTGARGIAPEPSTPSGMNTAEFGRHYDSQSGVTYAFLRGAGSCAGQLRLRQRAGVPAIRASRRVIGGRCKRNKPVLRRSEAVAIAQALRRRGRRSSAAMSPSRLGCCRTATDIENF